MVKYIPATRADLALSAPIFRVMRAEAADTRAGFGEGALVQLNADDGSPSPRFSLVSGKEKTRYLALGQLEVVKASAAKAPPKFKVGDKVVLKADHGQDYPDYEVGVPAVIDDIYEAGSWRGLDICIRYEGGGTSCVKEDFIELVPTGKTVTVSDEVIERYLSAVAPDGFRAGGITTSAYCAILADVRTLLEKVGEKAEVREARRTLEAAGYTVTRT